MNWLKKVLAKMAWPLIKKNLLNYVKSEEYQKNLVEKVNKKVDIPNVGEEAEANLLNQIYDAGQEVAVEFIENIDIDALVEKVL